MWDTSRTKYLDGTVVVSSWKCKKKKKKKLLGFAKWVIKSFVLQLGQKWRSRDYGKIHLFSQLICYEKVNVKWYSSYEPPQNVGKSPFLHHFKFSWPLKLIKDKVYWNISCSISIIWKQILCWFEIAIETLLTYDYFSKLYPIPSPQSKALPHWP